ncbi:hypothetical protein Bbelb_431090 [Branchiostoma belcheri]|nr:hypothetical protein Bbelb_431090 [Branchiostoma belcheri]
MCSNKMQSLIRRKRIRRGKRKRSSPLAAPRSPRVVLHARRKTEGGSPLTCKASHHRFSRQPCLRPCQSLLAPANTTQYLMDDRFCYSADSSDISRFADRCSPPGELSPTRDPAHIDFIYQSPDQGARQTFMEQDFAEVYDSFLCSFSQSEFAEELEAFGGRLFHTPPPRRNDEDDSYYPAPEDRELSVTFMQKDFEDMCAEIYTDNLHENPGSPQICSSEDMKPPSYASLELAMRSDPDSNGPLNTWLGGETCR